MTTKLSREQRAENEKLAAKINAYWEERGVIANARVEVRSVPVFFQIRDRAIGQWDFRETARADRDTRHGAKLRDRLRCDARPGTAKGSRMTEPDPRDTTARALPAANDIEQAA